MVKGILVTPGSTCLVPFHQLELYDEVNANHTPLRDEKVDDESHMGNLPSSGSKTNTIYPCNFK